LVHRRLEFRGTPRNIEIIKKLEKNGKIQIETPYQINSIEGDDKLKLSQ
jgi:thioredoxin reductase (NADPH)